MRARALAATVSLLVASCGRPEAPTSTAPTMTVSVSAAPTIAASVPVPATASAPAANDPVVMELRKAVPEKTLSLTAGGRVERRIVLPFGEEEGGVGQVTPASVEELHQVLRATRFCELAPKQRESAPGYTIIDARFPDVACLVELPDPRWEKIPAPKKVIDAARRIEAEAFPRP